MAENGLFPVSLVRHRNRFWRRFTSYQFVAEMDACPIVISEVPQIATSFPIVFLSNQTGFSPVALFSVIPEMAPPFVDQNGRWLAPYVPSALRCFPFQAEAMKKGGSRSRLFVDEDSGLVTHDPKDQPFFTVDGLLTQDLCRVRRFLQNRLASANKTDQVCSLIAEMGLLVPLDEQNGITLTEGYRGVDPILLERLPESNKLALLSSGALRLIHAHQVSLSHCVWLSSAQSQSGTRSSEQNDTFGGFMTALAEEVRHGQCKEGAIHAMG